MIRSVVVMGVSGSGKSTLGRALAEALGWSFVEGDELHPPANIAKMAAGVALDDADRAPFLANVAEAIAARKDMGVVAACSALKRRYRQAIGARVGAVVFILPSIDRATLEARMDKRAGHFMPSTLLDSQLAALEPPDADENAVIVDGHAPVGVQVAQAIARLRGLCPADLRSAAGA